MEEEFKILTVDFDRKSKFKIWILHPIFIPVILLVFAMLISFAFLAGKQVSDRYFPYEGKVIAIENKWYDRIIFEFDDDEHLIIETEAGEVIDRYINIFERVNNRIEKGDHVIKKKGFNEPVRAVGKKSADEMIEEMKKLKGIR